METLKLTLNEAEAYKLRQIVQDSSSFEAAVRRVAREKNVELGRAIRLARNNGGGDLYNKWALAGRPTIVL
jgi:hypothetical protein